MLDAQGHGVHIDIALHASFPETESGAVRVRSAAIGALEGAQDELTMVTADPWPRQGSGDLPTPRAVLTPDAAALRLFYGDQTNPVLELEQLLIADVLARRQDEGHPPTPTSSG